MLQNAIHVADVLFEEEVMQKIVVIQYTVLNTTALQVNIYLMYTLL